MYDLYDRVIHHSGNRMICVLAAFRDSEESDSYRSCISKSITRIPDYETLIQGTTGGGGRGEDPHGRMGRSSVPLAIPQINLRYTERARQAEAARGPGTSVPFINCYSLRPSLRLPRRDSALRPSWKRNHWRSRESYIGPFEACQRSRKNERERERGRGKRLGVKAKFLREREREKRRTLTRQVHARTLENEERYIPVQFDPPCISSVAAPGWFWRETGGYDYPL